MSEITLAPVAHSRFGPSAAHRWLACPGSLTLIQNFAETEEGARELAERPTSDAAARGTACHEIAAWAVANKKQPLDWPHAEAAGYPVDADMLADVDDAVRSARTFIQAMRGPKCDAQVFVEKQVLLGNVLGLEGQAGTADLVLLSGDLELLSVHDYKFGYTYISAQDNPQLKLYALGALDTLGAMARDVKTVELVIHQPKVSDVPDTWRISVPELLRFQAQVRDVVNLVQYNDLRGVTMHDLHPSEHTCQWCPIAARCPAHLNEIDRMMEDLTGEPVNSDEDRRDALEDARRLMSAFTDAKLDKLYPYLDTMTQFAESVRAELRSRAESGVQFENCKLVLGREGPRKWIDADKVKDELLKFYPREQVMTESVISPTQAEKQWKKTDEWQAVLSFITRSEAKPMLVPASDKRPAIEPITFDDLT